MQVSTGPIGILDKHKPVHIIGAGISGLVLAFYLKKYGHDVTVFEKDNTVGGKISTELTQHGPIENAANAIFAHSLAQELIDELGLRPLAAQKNLKKKIYKNKAVTSKFLRAKDLLRIIFSLLKRPPCITEKTTVEDFFRPLVGRGLIQDFLDAAFAGVYAIPSSELHFISVFKKCGQYSTYLSFLLDMKKNKNKAHSLSFENGMGEFTNALRENLKNNIQVNTKADDISDMHNIIICTEAYNAGTLLTKTHPKISEYLLQIPYIDLQTTTFFTHDEIKDLQESFGVVFSPKNHPYLKGILNNKAIFNERTYSSNINSYTVISKKLENPSSILEDELKKVFSLDKALKFEHFKTTYWKNAIPAYNQLRAELIQKIRSEIFSYSSGLVIFGNYVDGISIREMITHAKNFAEHYKLTREE